MPPHQIQHDAAVDIANRLVGRHLKFVQINFMHKISSTRGLGDVLLAGLYPILERSQA
jgi:uncharacterized protein YwlG (UPF0340 family)